MNQSGIQKTVGAMLLASGATLAIVILAGGTIPRFTNNEFESIATSPMAATAGALARPNMQQQPNQLPSQNGYPETRPTVSPQAYPVSNGQMGQASYIADSNYATPPNLVHHDARAHENLSYQVTSYPAIQHPNLPPRNQPQLNSNRAAAPQRAIPDYPLSQKLIQAQESREQAAFSSPVPRLAEPTPAKLPAYQPPETSVLTHVDSVSASPQQESNKAFSVLQTNFETRIQNPKSQPQPSAANLTSPIQVDKRSFMTKEVIIKNDTFDEALDETPVELVLEPTAKPATVSHPPQTNMPSRRRVDSQTEVNASKRIQYGESLARRRSHHAAREEFILALLMIANSHGNESANDAYTVRLVKGLAAMDEINDFASMRNRNGRDPQFQQAVYSHSTQILNGADLNLLSPRKAIDLYCGFSQSQIEQAIGFSTAGSKALHALGKLELKTPGTAPQQAATSQTRALVFFRSSLSVNPNNALCANDLGVLLFNMGRLREAEEALKRSVESAQSREVWQNLAAVHGQQAASATTVDQRNGRLRMVQLAEREAQKFQNDPRQRGLADTEWATTNDFQNNAAFPDTVAHRNSTGDAATSQPEGARVKAVSFLQKVTGWN
jgi:tetratricopeptide (TPR) repeat protein